jgi:hypothetical protein
MKKLTLLLIILSLNVFSQKNKEEYVLPHIVSAGVGYGAAWVIWKDSEANSNGSITEKRTATPVFSASYEQIVKKKLGIGYLGVGARVGYQSATWSWTINIASLNYDYKWNISLYDITLRPAYHFVLPNKPKIEPYAGLSMSYNIWKMRSTGTYNGTTITSKDKEAFLMAGAFGGVRFRVLKFISIYGELGFPHNLATVGANLQF